MNEYEVTLTSGTVYVYADLFVRLGGLFQFYQGDRVVQEFEDGKVIDVKEVLVFINKRQKERNESCHSEIKVRRI